MDQEIAGDGRLALLWRRYRPYILIRARPPGKTDDFERTN
jgi:hypothetical protein